MPFSRVMSGMTAKHTRGLAWHGDKARWVLAKDMAGPDAPPKLQEQNPRSYKKIGAPFALASQAPGGFGFWTPPMLAEAWHGRVIELLLGYRLEGLPAGHPIFAPGGRHLTVARV